MTDTNATAATGNSAPATTDLEQLKTVFNTCTSKMRRIETPTEELQILGQAVREAAANNRMGTDEDFAEFVNKELGIGLMQKLNKTMSNDQEVSDNDPKTASASPNPLSSFSVVPHRRHQHHGGLYRPLHG